MKVDQLDVKRIFGMKQNVFWLEVHANDLILVKVADCGQNISYNFACLALRKLRVGLNVLLDVLEKLSS